MIASKHDWVQILSVASTLRFDRSVGFGRLITSTKEVWDVLPFVAQPEPPAPQDSCLFDLLSSHPSLPLRDDIEADVTEHDLENDQGCPNNLTRC